MLLNNNFSVLFAYKPMMTQIAIEVARKKGGAEKIT
jgi:hypothetical protein